MKTIGLIGGLTWHSTIEYYRVLNQTTHERLGKRHSAPILLFSVELEAYRQMQDRNQWAEITKLIIGIAQRLEQGGADLLLIGCNTLHKIADEIASQINIPLVHIADAAAQAIKAQGLNKVGLIGSEFTMTADFYKKRLKTKYGLEVIIPEEDDRKIVHQIIYEELSLGQFKDSSREQYKVIIQKLADQGAQGAILGCTEIPLLIKPQDVSIPVFDTTYLHARAAVDAALETK